MCLTCKDRGILCIYKKSKNRGRPGGTRRAHTENEIPNTRHFHSDVFSISNYHSSDSSGSSSAAGNLTQLPVWDVDSNIAQSPPQDLQWFDIDNSDIFTSLCESQYPIYESQLEEPEHNSNTAAGSQSSTQLEVDNTASRNSLLTPNPHSNSIYQTFTTIDFSTTSLASRLLDDKKCSASVSADAETALHKLLQSDILNIDQKWETTQDIETELLDNSSLLQGYFTAAMNKTLRYSLFLDSEYLSQILNEVVTRATIDKTKTALIYTILAAGCQLYWSQPARRDFSKARKDSAVLFSIALGCTEAVSEAVSTTAFQALLSMSIFVMRWKPSQASRLLAKATSCAQYLKLNQAQTYGKLGLNNKEQSYLKRAFWLLYSIEKSHNARLGYFSMLTDATIDHWPDMTSMNKDTDKLIIFCASARLYSSTIQQLYSQEGLSKPSKALEATVTGLDKQVNTWKQEVVGDGRPTSSLDVSSNEGEVELSIHIQFHELMLLIHGRLITSNTSQDKIARSFDSERQYLESACAILDLTSSIDPTATVFSLALMRLQLIAFCIVAIYAHISQQSQKLSVYMGLACGSCARSSLILDMPFEEVNAVNIAAQQSIRQFNSS
ncbi:hypothetical protein F5884DRAFT_864918 [Xylogone sp. PMI_703]|nr:hypothetical protein F5884DRAFT_864918 [Xylogone sp. PMI_703]